MFKNKFDWTSFALIERANDMRLHPFLILREATCRSILTMMTLGATCVLLAVTGLESQPQKLSVNITSLSDGKRVGERPTVEGQVSTANAGVWVIVHPMELSDYWVQPRVSVRENGRWRAIVYLGRPGAYDIGKHFEVCAVANPRMVLREGVKLSNWPEAQAKSTIIEVIRE